MPSHGSRLTALALIVGAVAALGAAGTASPGLVAGAEREGATQVPSFAPVTVAVPSAAAAARTASSSALGAWSATQSGAAPSPDAASPCASPAERSPAATVSPAATSSTGYRDRRPVLPRGTTTKAVTAVFLGDSYTSGYNGFGYGSNGWAGVVSRALGWHEVNLAVPGTGFVNPGWTGQPLSTRIAAAVRAHPRVLVVATGHNDRRFGATAAGAAARVDLIRLHRALPDALIIVIAPIWSDGSPPASLLGLRDALRRDAAAIGAVFIDPLRGAWFAGAAHSLISGDGIHPTNAGHRHIAQLVLDVLRRSTQTGTAR